MHHSILTLSAATAAIIPDLTTSTNPATGSLDGIAALQADGQVGLLREAGGQANAAATLTVHGTRHVEAKGSLSFAGAVAPALSAHFALEAVVPSTAELAAAPAVDGQGLLVRDAVRAALSLLQAGCCGDSPTDPCLREAVINQVNASLQIIYSSSPMLGYFNRQTVTLTYAPGDGSQALSRDVQGLHGPVRLDTPRIILREVTDRGQFERYADTFYGGDLPDGPRAWHLEASNISGGDSVALTLHIAPPPIETADILVDVILEPPRYDWSDVTNGTPLSLPHRYAETLLLPLVRDWASSHEYFAEPELLPQVKQQAEMARMVLGLLNPNRTRSPKELPENA